MIHPAALPALPSLLPLGEVLPAQAAEGPEAADFSALLAIESETLAPPGVAAQMPVATLPTLLAPLPEAAILPEGGKPLPLALPVAVSGEISAPEPQSLPAPVAVSRSNRSPTAAEEIDPIETEPAASPEHTDSEAPVHAEPRSEALPVPQPQTAPAPAVAVVTAPAEGPALLQTLSPALPFPASILTPAPLDAHAAFGPALPRQVPVALRPAHPAQSAPLAPAEPGQQPQIAARPALAPITLSVVTAATVPAPPPGEPQPHFTLPLSGTEPVPQPAKLAISALRLPPAPSAAAERRSAPGKAMARTLTDLALPLAEPLTPAVALAAPAVLTLPAPAAFAPVDPALRPHDFTQLVDRLVAARELASPQAFAVALQHGEFGQVQLRFQREGDGLSVTMASADPDFARVVSAAPAPVLAALPAETAGQAGQRFDSPSQGPSANGHSAQHRGGSPERREDRHGPADNPVPPGQGDGRDPRRSGIFA